MMNNNAMHNYIDQNHYPYGNPLVHASSDWPMSVEVESKSSSFAQLQRPRSPVPAAAAIHERKSAFEGDNFAEVTYVPVATAGPCRTNCQMVMPFMVLLFFMTLLVAVTQVQIKLYFVHVIHINLTKIFQLKSSTDVTNLISDACFNGCPEIGRRRSQGICFGNPICHFPFVWLHSKPHLVW